MHVIQNKSYNNAFRYYPDFQNVLLCDDSPGGPSPTSHFQILKEETGLKTGNLRYNYEYDECIRQKMDFGVKPGKLFQLYSIK